MSPAQNGGNTSGRRHEREGYNNFIKKGTRYGNFHPG